MDRPGGSQPQQGQGHGLLAPPFLLYQVMFPPVLLSSSRGPSLNAPPDFSGLPVTGRPHLLPPCPSPGWHCLQEPGSPARPLPWGPLPRKPTPVLEKLSGLRPPAGLCSSLRRVTSGSCCPPGMGRLARGSKHPQPSPSPQASFLFS